MAEEIVAIKIIPDSLETGIARTQPAGATGGGGVMQGIGGVFQGAMKAIGIGSVVGAIVGIVANMKILTDTVGRIFKVVSLLLKPIADVITVLLMPILYILKPFMIILNQVMAPFLKQALKLLGEGGKAMAGGDLVGASQLFGAAGAVILTGLSSVIATLAGTLLKMIVGVLGDFATTIASTFLTVFGAIMAPILGFFGVSGEELTKIINTIQTDMTKVIGEGTTAIQSGIDTTVATLIASNALSAALISESVGVETDVFRKNVFDMITKTFQGADGITPTIQKMLGLTSEGGFGKVAKDTITDTITGSSGFNSAFTSGMDLFKSEGVRKIGEAVDAFNTEFDKMKNTTTGGDKTFWGTIGEAFMNIGNDAVLWG